MIGKAKMNTGDQALDLLAQAQPEAWRAGHASAMIANLHLAGSPERANVWEAEEAIWLQRRDEMVDRSILQRQMAEEAAEATRISYTLHSIPAIE
jgi:uncharacterized protein YbaP (TraB family)